MTYFDTFLNGITMYRLVLYGLGALAAIAILLGLVGQISYGPVALLESIALLITVCWFANLLLAKIYRAPLNAESTIITALILFFLLAPLASVHDALMVALTGVIAVASKYVLALHHKHLFNPAAIAAVLMGIFGYGGVFWWVGTGALLIPTLILGFLVVRKIRRFPMFFACVTASAVTMLIIGWQGSSSIGELFVSHFTSWPIIFFASIMLTEPSTTPPRRIQRILYAIFVGALSNIPFHLGPVFSTPEMALVLGNLGTYAVGMRQRLSLRFQSRTLIARDTYEFIFTSESPWTFQPGQYLEWTVPHPSDMRGIRRYFTIASSPTESDVRLGLKYSTKPSSFKKFFASLNPGDIAVAGQLAGDFVLPRDPHRKLAFLAGGIGVTPFRSMIKYLVDTNQKRDVVMLYANRSVDDIAYQSVFDTAQQSLGLKTVYVLTGEVPVGWQGEMGMLDAAMVRKHIPDFKDRTFYLAGPDSMVQAYRKLLKSMGVSGTHIETDYFPGFA